MSLLDVPKKHFYLGWEEGAFARARQTGQSNIPGDFLTLDLIKQMLSRVRRHVSLKVLVPVLVPYDLLTMFPSD